MIQLHEERAVRDRTADVVMDWHRDDRGSVDDIDLNGYLDLVAAAAIASEESDLVLRRWVSAARRAGASWEQVGTSLGVTRQAAQKRFASSPEDRDDVGSSDASMPHAKTRRGVTAFNEVDVLAHEGAACYEAVAAGWGKIHFRATEYPVENVRVVSFRRQQPIQDMEADGWTLRFSWYPYLYFSRPAR